MKKEMKTQIYRMLGIFFLLLIMSAWQIDFVIAAIDSSAFLNLAIIGFFLFGVILLYVSIRKMPNEIVAFESLQEFHTDILANNSGIEIDPYWKYQRCEKQPTIFKKPEILGQSYQMVYEQMARTNRLKISATTMQTLVDSVDVRLFDQKSLMQYITGLLVFMGLIGTFVGLMSTLASVGKIIGDLDLSSGAGLEVIQTLMTNLQEPLVGMATGFSSSLFGLVTSLTLGLMARFAAKHNDVLKQYFEDWLAGAAQLEDDKDYVDAAEKTANQNAVAEEYHHDSESPIDHRELRVLYRVAKNSVQTNKNIREQLQQLASAFNGLAAQQVDAREDMSNFAMHVANITSQQKEFGYLLEKTADAIAENKQTSITLDKIDNKISEKFISLETGNHHLQLQITDQMRIFDGKLDQKFEEANTTTNAIKATIEDEVQKLDNRVDNSLGQLHNNIGRLDRNHAQQIGDLKQLLTENHNQVQQLDILPETAETDEDFTQIMNQLDNLIKVKQLSSDDMKQLKNLSRVFVGADPKSNQPQSVKDLFNRIIDTYGEMAEDDEQKVQHKPTTEAEKFAAAVAGYDQGLTDEDDAEASEIADSNVNNG